jgi:hypothetical protein
MTNVDKHHSRGLLEKVSKQNGCFALRVDNHQDTEAAALHTHHSIHFPTTLSTPQEHPRT